MFIDLERDSAIRVQALMALAAYSVRQCSIALSSVQYQAGESEMINIQAMAKEHVGKTKAATTSTEIACWV
jgi:hypothetical protein